MIVNLILDSYLNEIHESIILAVFLVGFFDNVCKNNIYGNKTEQRAIKMAYTLLQVYYHANELCVSDSIEDLEWFLFSGMVDNQTKQILDSYRKEKDFIWNDPVYCEKIAAMFGSEVSDSCTYIAIFSEPYKGMIRCDILPKDRKIGVYGSPTIDAFLFKFNNKGEIYQLYKAIIDID